MDTSATWNFGTRKSEKPSTGVDRPQVAYRETVVRGVSGLVYRHVKQDRGAGQFAHVVLGTSGRVDGEPARGDGGRSAR